MDSFKSLDLKDEYRNKKNNVIKEFFVPTLSLTKHYKRAVGFFSSTSLLEISNGIDQMVSKGGKISLIASPRLSKDDVEAISSGYNRREEVLEAIITKSLDEPQNPFQEMRLNYIANLIAKNILDIKVAFVDSNNSAAMYHEKMGILEDYKDNYIAFTGSLNDSTNSFINNYETIDIYTSWNGDKRRIDLKIQAFEEMWNNVAIGVEIYSFELVKEEIIKKYLIKDIDCENYLFKNDSDYMATEINENIEEYVYDVKSNTPRLSSEYGLYEYQKKAIENWKINDYIGIFDMATGTGKTITGLSAIATICTDIDEPLFIVIVCPYQHLVEQWYTDVIKFNIKPIVAYSTSFQKNWKKRLKLDVFDQNIGVRNKRYVTLLTTNATFSSEYVQNIINSSKKNILLVVDEAHNFGASSLSGLLDNRFKYRLALSATLERYRDIEGTNLLKNYFGNKCIEYNLERAISEKKLTPYKYFIRLVYLTEEELEEYNQLSYEISKALITGANGKTKLSRTGEMLAIKRARLVAGAKNKIDELLDAIQPFRDDNFTLVYCGATSVVDDTNENLAAEASELKQIDLVAKVLWNKYGINVSKYTSEENIHEREVLKKEFSEGENVQVLAAIKCLDEGVNIPSIKRAFILASSTNPKEYIQRRGRVLRTAPEKDYAEIYDFVTIPRPLEDVMSMTKDEIKRDVSLIKNEIKRIYEFSRLSLNPGKSNLFINELLDEYDLLYEEVIEERN